MSVTSGVPDEFEVIAVLVRRDSLEELRVAEAASDEFDFGNRERWAVGFIASFAPDRRRSAATRAVVEDFAPVVLVSADARLKHGRRGLAFTSSPATHARQAR